MAQTAILEHMSALADATRSRMLLVLEGQELMVSEICAVMQLPQSTVSRHLKTLMDDGWVTSRRENTSRFYHMAPADLGSPAKRLWLLVRDQVSQTKVAMQDENRLRGALERRRSQSQEFFSSKAGQWDKLREEYFGTTFHLNGMLGLLDPEWTVGDLGCGTGQVAEALAPHVKSVIAVDESGAMLQAAKRRLRAVGNVDIRKGELESLPIEDGQLDAATLFLVLHHLPNPAIALSEVRRVLRPGGRIVITDMFAHDREEYRLQMGHVWLGFSEIQMTGYLTEAGFERVAVRPLPAEENAKGPGLFVASARKSR